MCNYIQSTYKEFYAMKKESSGVQTVKYTRVYEQIRASKGRREELLCEGFYLSFSKGLQNRFV